MQRKFFFVSIWFDVLELFPTLAFLFSCVVYHIKLIFHQSLWCNQEIVHFYVWVTTNSKQTLDDIFDISKLMWNSFSGFVNCSGCFHMFYRLLLKCTIFINKPFNWLRGIFCVNSQWHWNLYFWLIFAKSNKQYLMSFIFRIPWEKLFSYSLFILSYFVYVKMEFYIRFFTPFLMY